MTGSVIKVAVVGHTNTGKTSLLRALTRDPLFGDIANRASTTRHVEGTALLVDGQPLIEFYDTPGLEDSISLLEHLETQHRMAPDDWVAQIEAFLASAPAKDEFAQEAKSLRQIVTCDIILYVIDIRERVIGKYRDELTILSRTAKPVIPLLNFAQSPDAKLDQWRYYLERAGLHANLTFNPLVIDAAAERKLFEKMRALRDELYEPLGTVIDDLRRQRERLQRVSCDRIADLLIDVAAYKVAVTDEAGRLDQGRADLERSILKRERDCVAELLKLFGFTDVYSAAKLVVDSAEAGVDWLSPTALKELGARGGGGAAAGAAAGLALDVLLAGLSLGVGTAVGAGLGALYKLRDQGWRLVGRWRGQAELRAADEVLYALAARQLVLLQALLARSHADTRPVAVDSERLTTYRDRMAAAKPPELTQARLYPGWSRLNAGRLDADAKREICKQRLAESLQRAGEGPAVE